MLAVDFVGVEMIEKERSSDWALKQSNPSSRLALSHLIALYCVDVSISWKDGKDRRSECWSVKRRYSDFRRLLSDLCGDDRRARGLPQMPPKRAKLPIIAEVCEERINGLQTWLRAVITIFMESGSPAGPLGRLLVFLSPPASMHAAACMDTAFASAADGHLLHIMSCP